jgi:hypothetical protein
MGERGTVAVDEINSSLSNRIKPTLTLTNLAQKYPTFGQLGLS